MEKVCLSNWVAETMGNQVERESRSCGHSSRGRSRAAWRRGGSWKHAGGKQKAWAKWAHFSPRPSLLPSSSGGSVTETSVSTLQIKLFLSERQVWKLSMEAMCFSSDSKPKELFWWAEVLSEWLDEFLCLFSVGALPLGSFCSLGLNQRSNPQVFIKLLLLNNPVLCLCDQAAQLMSGGQCTCFGCHLAPRCVQVHQVLEGCIAFQWQHTVNNPETETWFVLVFMQSSVTCLASHRWEWLFQLKSPLPFFLWGNNLTWPCC